MFYFDDIFVISICVLLLNITKFSLDFYKYLVNWRSAKIYLFAVSKITKVGKSPITLLWTFGRIKINSRGHRHIHANYLLVLIIASQSKFCHERNSTRNIIITQAPNFVFMQTLLLEIDVWNVPIRFWLASIWNWELSVWEWCIARAIQCVYSYISFTCPSVEN